jgi:hypothetical protein
MSYIEAAQAFIAEHHLKGFVAFFSAWIMPAMMHVALRRAKMIEKNSKWDIRLRRLMKLTLDVSTYDDAEKKLEAGMEIALDKFVAGVPDDPKEKK